MKLIATVVTVMTVTIFLQHPELKHYKKELPMLDMEEM